MMKAFLVVVSLVISYGAWTQSLAEANKWFEKYEYFRAADLFNQYAQEKTLPLDDYKRLAYSYYVTGEYKKCLPIVDSIIRTRDFAPVFYYIHAEANMGVKNYEQAKASYVQYQLLDNEYNVVAKIASCDYIPNLNPLEYITNHLLEGNTSKADFTGGYVGNQQILYKEMGKDSLGELLDVGETHTAELFFVRPFVLTESGSKEQIIFTCDLGDISVPSITFSQKGEKVFFTVMRPIADDEIDQIAHIYTGDYNSDSFTVSNMSLWQFSGYEDSSSCAHATLNSSGDVLIFTKMHSNSTTGSDLFFSKKSGDGIWSKPLPLVSLNTGEDEMFPLFSGDSMITFSSNGRLGYGGLDIYKANIDGINISEIQHFAAPVNSFDDDFNFSYYSIDSARYSSNRSGGVGDDDMYFVKFAEPEEVIEILPDSTDFFSFIDSWKNQVIYFDLDKFNLKEETEKIIFEVMVFLDKYPKSSLSVTGHTDARGSVEYNLNLGLRRANSVLAELVDLGINSSQISTFTKGNSEPEVDCSSGCSEEDHALNRIAVIRLTAK
jgi:peptidoglycan-associated lipoprotein